MAVNVGIISQVAQQQKVNSSDRPLSQLVQIASNYRNRKDTQEARADLAKENRAYREEVRVDAAKIRSKERELAREDRKTQLVMSELLSERTRLENARIQSLQELKSFGLSENDINMTSAYPELVDMTEKLFDRDIDAYNTELLNPLRQHHAELTSKLGKLKAAKEATAQGAFDDFSGENNVLQRIEFEQGMEMLREEGTPEWLMAGYEAGYKAPTAASVRTATKEALKPFRTGADLAFNDMMTSLEEQDGGIASLATDEALSAGMPGYDALGKDSKKLIKKTLSESLLELKNVNNYEDFIEGATDLTNELISSGINVSMFDLLGTNPAARRSYKSMERDVAEIRVLEQEAEMGSKAARSLRALKDFSKKAAAIPATDATALNNLYESYANQGLFSEKALRAMKVVTDEKIEGAPQKPKARLQSPVETIKGDSMTIEEAKSLDMDDYLPYIYKHESNFDNQAVNKGYTDSSGVWHDNAFKSVDLGIAQINSQHYDRALLPAITSARGVNGGKRAAEAMDDFHEHVFASHGVSKDDTEGMQRLLRDPKVSEKAARYLMTQAMNRGEHPLADWGMRDTSIIGTADRIMADITGGVTYNVPENVMELYDDEGPVEPFVAEYKEFWPLLPDDYEYDVNHEANLESNDSGVEYGDTAQGIDAYQNMLEAESQVNKAGMSQNFWDFMVEGQVEGDPTFRVEEARKAALQKFRRKDQFSQSKEVFEQGTYNIDEIKALLRQLQKPNSERISGVQGYTN